MPEFFQQQGVNMSFQFVALFAGLVWVRMLGMVATIPFLFGKPVPMPVRVGGATMLMLFLVPLLLPTERPPLTENMLVLTLLFVKEAIYGIVIAFGASLVFYGFEAAGDMVDNQRGTSIARAIIPALGSMGSLSSQFFFTLAVVIYLSIGGHQLFLTALFNSFVSLPVMEVPAVHPGWEPLAMFLSQITGNVIQVALAISAPVIIAILVADIIMGVANRVAPQINVWELSFNLKGYVGILLMFFMLTLMMGVMEQQFAIGQGQTERVIDLLRGGEGLLPQPAVPGEAARPWPWIPKPDRS